MRHEIAFEYEFDSVIKDIFYYVICGRHVKCGNAIIFIITICGHKGFCIQCLEDFTYKFSQFLSRIAMTKVIKYLPKFNPKVEIRNTKMLMTKSNNVKR